MQCALPIKVWTFHTDTICLKLGSTNCRPYYFVQSITQYQDVRRMKKYWPSFVDDLKNSGYFDKRRSFGRFLSPTLLHQSQDIWMHAGRLFLGERRSIERSVGFCDSFHNHYTPFNNKNMYRTPWLSRCLTFPAISLFPFGSPSFCVRLLRITKVYRLVRYSLGSWVGHPGKASTW